MESQQNTHSHTLGLHKTVLAQQLPKHNKKQSTHLLIYRLSGEEKKQLLTIKTKTPLPVLYDEGPAAGRRRHPPPVSRVPPPGELTAASRRLLLPRSVVYAKLTKLTGEINNTGTQLPPDH